MKMNAVELFAALGERFRDFGDTPQTRQIAVEACRANAWFSPREIRRSMTTIAERMLRREELERWLAAYPVPVAAPRRVLVVMAGNIPLVGFFDLLCVVAAGHRCAVKPSAKDSVLIDYTIEELRSIDPEIAIEYYNGTSPVDAVIATGGDNARRHFQARYADIPTLLRGHRQSAAVLSGAETPQQLAALADDLWAYSGLGCRNVSRLFLPEGYRLQLEMPPMNPKFRNDYLRARALLTMTRQPFIDLGCAVAVEQAEFPASLSRVAYTRYRDLSEAAAWLEAHDQEIQCVVTECLPHSRRVGFGEAQSPSLTDWPDERDVMAWLTKEVH